jgi:tetratricopeptide (TPR) repeat protein
MTLPSHASILTGRLPPRHGLRTNGMLGLPEETRTLAERFRDLGYRTGGFVGAFVLDRRFGLAQGFETYDDRIPMTSASDFRVGQRPAGQVLGAADRWLAAQPADRPWLAWIHLFDPHTPYDAPRRTSNAYDDEVVELDRQLGVFLQRQREAGRLDRTVIALTADHGEALGDHGEETHGLFAYESTLRVPLILAGAGVRPATVEAPVSHVDLSTTLLAAAGARADATDGRDLSSEAAGSARPIYFEAMDASVTRGWAPLTGIVLDRWKYIELPIPELYDLEADPQERENRAGREPDRERQLTAHLRALSASSGPAPIPAALDAQAAGVLRSLGYVGGSSGPRQGPYTEADDPKTLLPLHRRFMEALDQAASGHAEAAIAALREVIGRRPDFAAAYSAAATLLMEAQRPGEAARLLDQARQRGAVSPAIDQRLGAALLASGDVAGALTALRRADAAAPGDSDTLNLMAVAFASSGDSAAARDTLKRALALAPSAAGMWTNLGLLEMQAGRRADASAAFQRAIDADPGAVEAWRALGAVRMDAGDARGAIDAWQRAVDVEPDAATLYNLSIVLADVSPRDAIPYRDRFLATPGAEPADRARIAALRERIRRTAAAPDAPKGGRR